MPCTECDAFRAAHNTAIERYTALTAELHKMATDGQFRASDYQKLKIQVADARHACDIARAALRVHKKEHKPILW